MTTLPNQTLITLEGRATYERILSLIDVQNPEEAIRHIKNFLQIYPDFAQAHNDLAVLFYRSGNNLKALAHYEKANRLDPTNVTYRKNLADFYFSELEWQDEAIHTYQDILKENPTDVESLNAAGMISLQLGLREQARQYFTRTLNLDTSNCQAKQAMQQLGEQAPPQKKLARISCQTPQTTPQLQAPATPQTISPSLQPVAGHGTPQYTSEHLHQQACQAANSGNISEACRLLEELVVLYPACSVAHNDLGVLCQQKGDISRARHHHEEAVRLQPDNLTFRKNLADLLYIACGETEEALKLYLEILGDNSRDIETLKAISQICIETGKFVDARTFLESILTIEPWNEDARESLGCLRESPKPAQPSSCDFISPDQLYAEAQRLVTENREDEAISVLEKLLQSAPDHSVAHNDLGVLRYRLGDLEGAGRAYEKAVELQPSNATFRKNLADLYFTELGRADDAIRIYLDLFREQPRDVETLSGLGHICATVGRPDEAKIFYRKALEIEPWNADIRAGLSQLV